MKFSDDMIGKRVKEIDTDDEGIILHEDTRWIGGAMVDWKTGNFIGMQLSVCLDSVVFMEPSGEIQPEEITINGKRYKLTLIKD